MPGPGSYTNGMPRRSQNGGAMNESFAQHAGQTPARLTGTRQAAHSVGRAISRTRREVDANAVRQTVCSAKTAGQRLRRCVLRGQGIHGRTLTILLPLLKLFRLAEQTDKFQK